MKPFVVVIPLTILCVGAVSLAQVGPAARAPAGGAPAGLGSLDFMPSPEHPVGWRGDGTGRFPAANSPTHWSRRVQGITTELKYQATKPTGDAGKDAVSLEYFAIKDWLYTGPFPVEDPVRDIDKDLLGGEGTVEPDVNGKAGDSVWKPLHIAMVNQMAPDWNNGGSFLSVDFTYLFGIGTGKDEKAASAELNDKAAYAHTYIYSPREAKVRLEVPFTGAAARVWINGKACADSKKTNDVMLGQGWNRLLIKVTVKSGVKPLSWLCRAYMLPPTPVSYVTKNVAWMTKLPGLSVAQPIVVGDKIFTGSGTSDLVCISKKDGKILWLKSNTYCDVLTDEEKKGIPDYQTKFVPKYAKLVELNGRVVQAINAAVSAQGLRSDQAEAMEKLLKEKHDTEWALAKDFAAADHKQFGVYGDQSNSTPCSDGHAVYWVCNESSAIFTGYDLDGNRLWAHHEALGTTEHGSNASMALAEGKLVYTASHTRLALDAKTGAVVWNGAIRGNCNANSPVIARIGDVPVVVHGLFLCRLSDGVEICPMPLEPWADYTPIVENGMVYSPCHWMGWGHPQNFVSVKLPDQAEPGAKAVTLWNSDGKETTLPQRGGDYMIASPLYLNGIVYALEMTGAFTANDVLAQKNVYRLYLEGHNRYNRGLFGYCASPTFAGKHIYITDDVGYTHLIEPGPAFKEVAANILENLNLTGRRMCWGGNPGGQEEFYTAPWFEGKTMFLRGTDYLYCIREQ